MTGGAGYIGAILTERLLERGYKVRVLDRLYWGEKPLERVRDRIELVVADVRDIPATALDGVDGVIHLAGLSNDPTAEYDPEANWQMNAVATEALGKACVERGVERVVFSSSCSLYDGLPPGMHDENAAVQPRGAYSTSKHYGEQALLGLQDQGLCPVILRNGTVYGHSPRMRFDLVVNTFVKDALVEGRLLLHGGGWMWRPLVDVRDVSDAMVAAYEAPEHIVKGEIYNVLHSNYQIRELAMLVAGSVQLVGATVRLEEAPAPKLTRDYECSNAKLSAQIGFIPAPLGGRGRVRHARGHRHQGPVRSSPTRGTTTSAGSQLLHEVQPRIEEFGSVSVSARRVLITGGGGQLASDLAELLGGSDEVSARSREELDVTDDVGRGPRLRARSSPTWSSTAPPSTTWRCASSEEDRASEVNVRAVKRLAERCAEHGAKFVHLSTNYVFDGTARRAVHASTTRPRPRSVYAFTKLGGEYAALAYAPDALVARTAGLYGLHGSASKGGNFVTRMSARAREQGALKMVADQRLSPTYTADLARGPGRGASSRAPAGSCTSPPAVPAPGSSSPRRSWRSAGIDVEIEPVETTRAPGGADRPLNGVLDRRRTDSLGLTPLRHWREGLAEYMERAGLSAAPERAGTLEK